MSEPHRIGSGCIAALNSGENCDCTQCQFLTRCNEQKAIEIRNVKYKAEFDRLHAAWHTLFEFTQAPYPFKKPCVSLQWKGTDICGDFHCVCGAHGHVDDDFVYYYKCAKCGRVYSMPSWMPLLELTPEMLKLYEQTNGPEVTKTDPSVRDEDDDGQAEQSG